MGGGRGQGIARLGLGVDAWDLRRQPHSRGRSKGRPNRRFKACHYLREAATSAYSPAVRRPGHTSTPEAPTEKTAAAAVSTDLEVVEVVGDLRVTLTVVAQHLRLPAGVLL